MSTCKTNNSPSLLTNQSGFVLVLAILILVVLVVIGISTTKNSQIDLQIVGNDKVNKQTFYRAESGVELGSRIIEENTACPNGFTANGLTTLGTSGITVANPVFWQNTPAWFDADTPPPTNSLSVMDRECPQPKPGSGFTCYAAQAFSFTDQNNWPSNIAAAGTTKLAAGSAIQMVAGYEGKGKGAAAGGGVIDYAVVSQAQGTSNSISEVEIFWQHLIGLEGACNY